MTTPGVGGGSAFLRRLAVIASIRRKRKRAGGSGQNPQLSDEERTGEEERAGEKRRGKIGGGGKN